MTVYYVMTDGLNNGIRAAGGYASRQITDFATLGVANYYANIAAVISGNTLADDDEIVCANTHDYDYSTTSTLVLNVNIHLYTVLYTDLTDISTGASEQSSGAGADIIIQGLIGKVVIIDGISFSADDDILFNTLGQTFIFNNNLFAFSGSGSSERISIAQDGANIVFNDPIFNFTSVDHGILGSYSSNITINGGSVTYNGTTPTALFYNNGSGGANLYVNNFDMSAITAGLIIEDPIVADDNMAYEFTRCKLNSGASLFNGSMKSKGQTIDAWSIDAGDGYHYFEHYRFEGIVLESTTVTRDLGATYDGTNQFSAELQTNTNIEAYTQPLRYKLGDYELDLTSGKTLTFHLMLQNITVPTVLTDHECWLEVVYPDPTDNALGKTVSSRTTDVLDTPINLSLSNKTWSGTTGELTKMQLSVNIPASIVKAPITAYLHLAKDVTAIGATEFFACPKPEIS